ncbi:hypothetical protein [Lacticaseibacillus manihotivorans]|uniref:hypothetical protein n=1 Tax=Lacticaseibacillus manihotivorans TaxID=88233 RepID=UPI000AE95B33
MADTAKVRFGDESVASVNVFTPKTDDFSHYIHLSTPQGNAIKLPQQGAVISQKKPPRYSAPKLATGFQ